VNTVAAAARQLTYSGKRPYVSAVCRHLGVWPPALSRSTVRRRVSAVAETQLALMHQLLAQRGATKPSRHQRVFGATPPLAGHRRSTRKLANPWASRGYKNTCKYIQYSL
jgi:hypothetical protein